MKLNKFLKNGITLILMLASGVVLAAGGTTPYYDQDVLPRDEVTNLTNDDWENMTPLANQDEVTDLVNNMRKKAETDADKHFAIGLRSGMSLYKNDKWQQKIVFNREGLNGQVPDWAKTKNNITWYPDDKKFVGNDNQTNVLEGLRITSGRFNMGNMPLVGQAFLEIPYKNMRKDLSDPNIIWFKAEVTQTTNENGEVEYESNLEQEFNYYQVLGVKAPIIDFLGSYNKNTGEWNVKFIINSNTKINPSLVNPIWPSTHPKLDLEVYSTGFAL